MQGASSKTSGRVYKRVVCEKCAAPYRYELTRQSRALPFVNFIKMVFCVLCFPVLFVLSLFRPIPLKDGRTLSLLRFRPANRLRDTMMNTMREGGDELGHTANISLRDKLLRGIEPVACPDCGWLQHDMVEDIRAHALGWVDLLAVGVLCFSQLLALLTVESTLFIGMAHLALVWGVWTAGGLMAMFAMLMIRGAICRKIDPNKNFPAPPEPIPGAPPAIREADRQKEVAANTAQLLGQIRKKEVPFRQTAILPNALPGK